MKWILFTLACCLLGGCVSGFRMAVPDRITSQSTRLKVDGSRSRHIKLGDFKTTRIKRGMRLAYPGWGRTYFLDNLLLNRVGVNKSELVEKEKDRFRFSVAGSSGEAQVIAREFRLQRSLSLGLTNNSLLRNPIINSFQQLQEFDYIFSATITTDSTAANKTWELLMRSYYNRKDDTAKNLFTLIPQGDAGIASNGVDTLHIKPLMVQETVSRKGKPGKLPIKLVTGYELRIGEGIVAVIDALEKSVWVYNEVDNTTRTMIAAITSAIFARRVKDVQW